jgi:D-alanine-D-alanine ligase
MKTRVGIVFGGRSGEHEISIRSAKTVIGQIDREKIRGRSDISHTGWLLARPVCFVEKAS